jgi:endoglucanase
VRILAAAATALALSAGTAVTASAPAQAATPACQVTYTIVNSWPGGFQAGLTITNNGPALSSWSVGFEFSGNQQIGGLWDGVYTQTGSQVTVSNETYNAALATGASISPGFTGTVTSTDNAPTYFTLNGVACNGSPQLPAVNLTTPQQDQVIAPGTNIALTATAAETAGTATIGKVSFYQGTTLIGSATSSPYTVTWSDVPKGFYTLTAQATDSAGETNTSLPIQITVLPTGSAPQLHVSGNKLVNQSGDTVVLNGVDRSGGEYACVNGTGVWDGPMDAASVEAMRSWGVNAVRVPLNEACWLGESYVNPAYAGATYQSAVEAYVALLHQYGIVAILDLHWTDGAYTGTSAGCSSAEAICQKPMPDAPNSVTFWTQVATAFKGDDATVFDLFNEPYPERADNYNETEGWQCWLNGGSSCVGIGYTVAGMQTLVNAVRSTGANNVIMLGGLEYSNDLTQWLQYEPTDPDGNLAASWHSYNFNTCSTQSCWTSQIAPVAAKVPVVAGEIGENDCADTYVNQLMPWLDSEGISYLAWTWDDWANGCATGPTLITDYLGDPTPFGAGVQSHLQTLAIGA